MQLLRLILIWLCIFSSFEKIHSQLEFQDRFKELYDAKEVTSIPKTIDSLIDQAIVASEFRQAAEIAIDLAHSFYRKAAFDHAIIYASQAVNIREQYNILDSGYCRSLYRLGVYYYRNKEFQNSIDVHKKIIQLNSNENYVARSYSEIGRNYNKLLDFYKAISYHNEGISRLEKLGDYENLKNTYINLAAAYNTMDTKESHLKNIEVLEELLALQDSIEFDEADLYSFYNQSANNYGARSFFNFDKALHFYNKNLEIAKRDEDSAQINTLNFNLGNVYNTVKDVKALPYIETGIRYSQSFEDEIIGQHLLSDYYKNQEKLQEALHYIDTSIQININSQSAPKAIKENKIHLLESRIAKVAILLQLYQQSDDVSYAQQALRTIILTDEFIDIIQNENFETASIFHWRNTASALYAQGVYCSKILEDDAQAFYFTEKNKALLLTQAIFKNTERDKIPKVVTEKERALTKNILKLEHQIIGISDSERQKVLQNQLFTEKQKRERFLDSLQPLYPNYFSTKTSTAIYPLKTIQTQLDQNEVIISYVWNKTVDLSKKCHGIIITNQNTNVFEVPLKGNFEILLKNYRHSLSKPFETHQDRNQFQETAYQLYTKLFPTQEIREIIKNKHLIIVPDNDLQTIPFEALITNRSTNTYLIEHTETSYAYSISSLLHNAEAQRETAKNFIGFAPSIFKDNTLDSLPNTISELNAIQASTKGTSYYKNEAIKSTFLKEAPNYSVIHLATHADASQPPWIAFQDKKLSLNELYTFYNQAELVVLSACNTSLGEIASGEGALNLARGFFYSGTNTVVSSLWNTNDKSAATLFDQFYKNLNDDQSKSEALRNTKLQYIQKHASSSQASPYYWAPFILIGDSGVLPQKDNNVALIITISLLLVLLAVILYKLRLSRIREN